MKKNALLIALTLIFSLSIQAQDDDNDDQAGSVIQNLTPSKLIGKGQVDIKWFNNIFTSTRQVDGNGDVQDVDRVNFFTSTLEAFFGVGDNRRLAIGGILEFRSNTIGGRGLLDVFAFDGERGTARSGLTNIAPSIKWVPFENVGNFSLQSSLFIPTFGSETEDGSPFIPVLDTNGLPVIDGFGNPQLFQENSPVFLDQDGFTWQNRFFYDLPLGTSKEWQLFFDLNTEYNFGSQAVFDDNGNTIEGSFANDSLRFVPGAFISYFPSSKFTIQGLVQHFQLVALTEGNFEQDQTAAGLGVKYQLTDALNIEGLYTNFFRGSEFTNTGETFNIGLRYVLKSVSYTHLTLPTICSV